MGKAKDISPSLLRKPAAGADILWHWTDKRVGGICGKDIPRDAFCQLSIYVSGFNATAPAV